MHEYSLTKRIVQTVNDAAAERGAKRVNAVFLVIGENNGVIPESVQMYFDIIAKGTAAQGAILHTHVIRSEMYCPLCGENFRRPRFSFACPACGTLGSPTQVGGEFYVERIQIEETE